MCRKKRSGLSCTLPSTIMSQRWRLLDRFGHKRSVQSTRWSVLKSSEVHYKLVHPRGAGEGNLKEIQWAFFKQRQWFFTHVFVKFAFFIATLWCNSMDILLKSAFTLFNTLRSLHTCSGVFTLAEVRWSCEVILYLQRLFLSKHEMKWSKRLGQTKTVPVRFAFHDISIWCIKQEISTWIHRSVREASKTPPLLTTWQSN